MKRAMFSVLTLIVLVGLVGCATQHGRHPLLGKCRGCDQQAGVCQSTDGTPCDEGNPCERQRCCRLCNGRGCNACCEQPAAGPATGAITYPYYTTRGPRDFYAKNPGSIGP
jgi:hypothetical protein